MESGSYTLFTVFCVVSTLILSIVRVQLTGAVVQYGFVSRIVRILLVGIMVHLRF